MPDQIITFSLPFPNSFKIPMCSSKTTGTHFLHKYCRTSQALQWN